MRQATLLVPRVDLFFLNPRRGCGARTSPSLPGKEGLHPLVRALLAVRHRLLRLGRYARQRGCHPHLRRGFQVQGYEGPGFGVRPQLRGGFGCKDLRLSGLWARPHLHTGNWVLVLEKGSRPTLAWQRSLPGITTLDNQGSSLRYQLKRTAWRRCPHSPSGEVVSLQDRCSQELTGKIHLQPLQVHTVSQRGADWWMRWGQVTSAWCILAR